jgi:hypothetical protein
MKSPPRPAAIRDPETGRVTYEGSLTYVPKRKAPPPESRIIEPQELSMDQKQAIFTDLQRGEHTPETLVKNTEGLNLEAVREVMNDWERAGKITKIKDGTGWMARPDEDICVNPDKQPRIRKMDAGQANDMMRGPRPQRPQAEVNRRRERIAYERMGRRIRPNF